VAVSTAFAVVAVIASYALGTFPSAQLAGRWRGVDPTAAGSRNPGATNVLRTAGREAAALTLAGDLGKGVVAAGLGWMIGGHGLGVACGLAAVLGHVAPVTRGLHGGKGVATLAGVAIVLFPLAAAVAAVVFLWVLALTRVVSAASLAAALWVPVAAALLGAPRPEVLALAVCAAVLVVRHRENLGRLRRGEEPRLRRVGGGV
jgi:acyl phosphate:glycerol-3-phosphate acyltransferase